MQTRSYKTYVEVRTIRSSRPLVSVKVSPRILVIDEDSLEIREAYSRMEIH
jgi:hypothetical protein